MTANHTLSSGTSPSPSIWKAPPPPESFWSSFTANFHCFLPRTHFMRARQRRLLYRLRCGWLLSRLQSTPIATEHFAIVSGCELSQMLYTLLHSATDFIIAFNFSCSKLGELVPSPHTLLYCQRYLVKNKVVIFTFNSCNILLLKVDITLCLANTVQYSTCTVSVPIYVRLQGQHFPRAWQRKTCSHLKNMRNTHLLHKYMCTISPAAKLSCRKYLAIK